MKLNFRVYGEGKPLIIAHGLYGSSDNWHSIAKELAENFKVYAIDQRNHGKSASSDKMSYNDMATDIKELMDEENIRSASLLGHSMGGKTVMRFATMFPDSINNLVVVDIAPKSYVAMHNFGRETTDHDKIIDALMKLDLDKAENRSDLENELGKNIRNSGVRQFLLKNVERNKDGSFSWSINLSALKDNLTEILNGFSDVPPKKQDTPSLFIRGEESNYILDEDMHRIRKFFSQAELVTIPGAGHWLHAEQPELFIKTVNYFLLD